MDQKKAIYAGMLIGSVVGGYIPQIWDSSFLSLWGVLFTAIGGFTGIWIGYKISS